MKYAKPVCAIMLGLSMALGALSAAQAARSTSTYDVAPGACSVFEVPVTGTPVLLMGTATGADVGVGQVTFLRSGGESPLLMWAGVDAARGAERGFALRNNPGILIMYLDYSANIGLYTANRNRIQVCNASTNGVDAKGYLTFIY
jgi:hypothetical protein